MRFKGKFKIIAWEVLPAQLTVITYTGGPDNGTAKTRIRISIINLLVYLYLQSFENWIFINTEGGFRAFQFVFVPEFSAPLTFKRINGTGKRGAEGVKARMVFRWLVDWTKAGRSWGRRKNNRHLKWWMRGIHRNKIIFGRHRWDKRPNRRLLFYVVFQMATLDTWYHLKTSFSTVWFAVRKFSSRFQALLIREFFFWSPGTKD